MKSLHLRSLAALAAGALLLAGCTENKPAQEGAASSGASGASNALNVTSTNDDCQVSAASASSGNVTFTIKNDGAKITEFYLLASDGLRIVSERENIAPGATADLTVSLQPGDYFTACKPGMRGTNVGKTAFKVTGDPVELSGDDQALFDKAVQDYVDFVKNEVSALVPKTDEFAKAYMAGDDEKAKQMFASTRVHYERIEPIAEALGVLDPRIDYPARSTISPKPTSSRRTTRPSPNGWDSTALRKTCGRPRPMPCSLTAHPPWRAGAPQPLRTARGSVRP